MVLSETVEASERAVVQNGNRTGTKQDVEADPGEELCA